MTRDEAIRCMMDYCPISDQHPRYIECGAIIDRYARLGMLKLDEPKSAQMKFQEVVASLPRDQRYAGTVWTAIDAAGLKIIEK